MMLRIGCFLHSRFKKKGNAATERVDLTAESVDRGMEMPKSNVREPLNDGGDESC